MTETDSQPQELTQNSKLKTQNSSDPLAEALEWDLGTAYEMLLSLGTLFSPKVHGVPAPWAAGVRKRLTPQSQADLKAFIMPPFGVFTYVPLHLVFQMPRPKDAAHFLEYIEAIPGEDFSRRIHGPLIGESDLFAIVRKALDAEKLTDADVEEYRKAVGRLRVLPPPSVAETRKLFADMANPVATKQRWLAAMREYHAVFFVQEELRLEPVLKRMAKDAQKLSRSMHVTDLIERLSNGYTISEESNLKRLTLVPSVWLNPFVIPLRTAEQELLLIWGAHPPGYKLAPGESVPDQALLVLRALGDPTRLRLLRLLVAEPRTPQTLAHELKLSLPTVSHHMRELRIAGLVRLEANVGEKGRENRYTVRWQSAELAFSDLARFVLGDA